MRCMEPLDRVKHEQTAAVGTGVCILERIQRSGVQRKGDATYGRRVLSAS